MRVTTAKRKMTTNNAFLQSAKRASLIAALLACCSTAQSDELSSGLIDSAQLKSRHSANPAASFPQHAANSLQQHQAAAAQRARNLARGAHEILMQLQADGVLRGRQRRQSVRHEAIGAAREFTAMLREKFART